MSQNKTVYAPFYVLKSDNQTTVDQKSCYVIGENACHEVELNPESVHYLTPAMLASRLNDVIPAELTEDTDFKRLQVSDTLSDANFFVNLRPWQKFFNSYFFVELKIDQQNFYSEKLSENELLKIANPASVKSILRGDHKFLTLKPGTQINPENVVAIHKIDAEKWSHIRKNSVLPGLSVVTKLSHEDETADLETLKSIINTVVAYEDKFSKKINHSKRLKEGFQDLTNLLAKYHTQPSLFLVRLKKSAANALVFFEKQENEIKRSSLFNKTATMFHLNRDYVRPDKEMMEIYNHLLNINTPKDLLTYFESFMQPEPKQALSSQRPKN